MQWRNYGFRRRINGVRLRKCEPPLLRSPQSRQVVFWLNIAYHRGCANPPTLQCYDFC